MCRMELITVREAAEFLGMSEPTIRRYVTNNTKGFRDRCVRQTVRLGKMLIIKSALVQWVQDLNNEGVADEPDDAA